MVKIRLKRTGKRNEPHYRLCVMDSREERDGRSIEDVGYYNPAAKTLEQKLSVKKERVEHWLKVGAQMTKKVEVLLKKAGISKK
ncbi:MAG: 30S ribosomal protein S16 [Planctomycetota bacterium]|nr:30S ribosomal protein S16 [Planctomycetota bacterium]